jgi:hypothetical protein
VEIRRRRIEVRLRRQLVGEDGRGLGDDRSATAYRDLAAAVVRKKPEVASRRRKPEGVLATRFVRRWRIAGGGWQQRIASSGQLHFIWGGIRAEWSMGSLWASWTSRRWPI